MYLVAPKYCHRFVGFLEEGAPGHVPWRSVASTAGRFPTHASSATSSPLTPLPCAPPVAHAVRRGRQDVLVLHPADRRRDAGRVGDDARADEAIHRDVNHAFADIGPGAPNPFA
jgi:hypothetical protein